jgi:hypothetical protein
MSGEQYRIANTLKFNRNLFVVDELCCGGTASAVGEWLVVCVMRGNEMWRRDDAGTHA